MQSAEYISLSYFIEQGLQVWFYYISLPVVLFITLFPNPLIWLKISCPKHYLIRQINQTQHHSVRHWTYPSRHRSSSINISPKCFCHHVIILGRNTFMSISCVSMSTVLLEKSTGPQPIKKFPALYGTRRIITAFTSARQLSLPTSR